MVKGLLFFLLVISPHKENPITPWGRDATLTTAPTTPTTISLSIQTRAATAMIRFFQNYISPIDGPRSHYFPSSSQYTLLAIQKYGPLKGIPLGCDRLMRENSQMWVYETITTEDGLRKLDPVR